MSNPLYKTTEPGYSIIIINNNNQTKPGYKMHAFINERDYILGHGKAPRGNGTWAFLYEDGTCEFIRGTYSKAKAEAKKRGYAKQIKAGAPKNYIQEIKTLS